MRTIGKFQGCCSNPDWLGNLSHRTAFTYDSGCLSCHAELQQAAGGDRAELIAHRSYFRGTTAKACTDCHLGPDHPDIEVYENSKHGQIYAAEDHTWNWTAAPDAWEPGLLSYRDA